MSKYFQRNAQYYIVAFCAIIAYLLIYGYYILNPFYTDWLLGHGDLSQHYLGWQAFQNGSWMFPIGMTNQLAYPSASSIIWACFHPCSGKSLDGETGLWHTPLSSLDPPPCSPVLPS